MAGTETFQRLSGECGEIAWHELQRHFARGALVKIAADLDLVAVASAIADDDKVAVSAWIDRNQLRVATVDDARDWQQRQPTLRAVVTAPWVVVQEVIL
jgi:hypothetical protein